MVFVLPNDPEIEWAFVGFAGNEGGQFTLPAFQQPLAGGKVQIALYFFPFLAVATEAFAFEDAPNFQGEEAFAFFAVGRFPFRKGKRGEGQEDSKERFHRRLIFKCTC